MKLVLIVVMITILVRIIVMVVHAHRYQAATCHHLLTNTTSSNVTQQRDNEMIYRLEKTEKTATTTAPATPAAVAAAPAAPGPPQPTPLSPSCCTPQKFHFPLPEARRFPDQSMQKNLCLGSTLV